MPKAESLVATIDLCLSEDSQIDDMQNDQDSNSSSTHKKKSDINDTKSNANRKIEKKGESKDKPRIVLTFRSEKTGAKSTNMKIVSTEEKQEEVSPRRSTRLGTKGESDYECEVSLKCDKSKYQTEDDSFENPTPKRSIRWRNKDSCENVLANAIARKETYNELSSGPAQRPSRRIKPTAKVIANQEINELQSRVPEDGIRTRSTRATARQAAGSSDKKISKEVEPEPEVDVEDLQDDAPKIEHFSGLGLKAIKSVDVNESEEDDEINENEEEEGSPEGDDEEIDDDTEVINQLLEEDDTSDDDYSMSEETEYKVKPQRPKRKAAQIDEDNEEDMPIALRLSKRRESSRGNKYSKGFSNPSEHASEEEEEEVSDAANGEAGEEAAAPREGAIAGACFCQAASNVHAAPGELPEPVYCQAIELVDEVRVGCSHLAARDAEGALCSMLRASLRAPYFLACELHAKQLRNHMCCPTCGLFCSQGTFLRCSQGHFFHVECGLLGASAAASSLPGCPHCGVSESHWQPVNVEVSRIKVTMKCSNKRIYMPEQREQCTPAFLTFPTSEINVPEGPVIPEDLLPPGLDVDLQKTLEETVENDAEEVMLEEIRDAIEAGETLSLVPKIVSAKSYINQPIDASGATLVHAAAASGRLFALHALRCAGANVDVQDCNMKTPLMTAISALLETPGKESPKKTITPSKEPVKSVESMDIVINNDDNTKIDLETETETGEDDNTKDVDAKSELDEEVKCEEKTDEVVEMKSATEDDKGKPEEKKDVDDKDHIEKKSVTTEDESKSVKEETIIDEAKVDLKADNESIDEEIKAEVNNVSVKELLKVIRYLVVASSDLDIAGPDGLTALHMSAQHGSAEVCEVILSDSVADINAKDLGGWTPLVYAAENQHAKVVKVLMSHDADPSVADNEGNTALHWAALGGDARCTQLLATVASCDHVNLHGDTALHIAARQDHYPCVAILLAHGARTDLENSDKELAIDVASGASRAAISMQMQIAIEKGDTRVRTVLSNDISNGRELYPVPCVNEVDDAELPTNFTYVTDHVMPSVITVDHTLDTMKGCSCTDDCSSGACECTSLSVRRWYQRGRLLPNFPYRDAPMLLECNATCKCNAKRCVNSVVTRLSKRGSVWARVEVYRAGGARGWGLRAAQRVPRGAPVALYVGELLLPAAADARSHDTYMFALDVKQDLLEECVDKRALCVDAAAYGNAARFVNHSCRANLAPVRLLRDTRDVRLPAAVLFAARPLAPGDPLTFDYGDKFWSVKRQFISCECGEPDCRYSDNSEI